MLVIEPDNAECVRLIQCIGAQGVESQAVAAFNEFEQLPEGKPWDLVFLAPESVVETLHGIARIRELGFDPLIVLMIETGNASDALAVLDNGPVIAMKKPVVESDVESILALISV